VAKREFGAFSEEREAPLETGSGTRGVERLDEKLPDFGHRFERAAAERIGVGGNAAPAMTRRRSVSAADSMAARASSRTDEG